MENNSTPAKTAGCEQGMFVACLRLSNAAARDQFLSSACGDDLALRHRVEQLLTAHKADDSFLERPAAELCEVAALSPVPNLVGTTIGPYKLLEQIGEGGMGVVYMAEQTNEGWRSK